MSSARVSAALRAGLLLVLVCVCAGLQLAPVGATKNAARPCAPHVAPPAAYESGHAGGGEADTVEASVLHRDRRRPATAPAPGAARQPVTHAVPLADRPADRPGGTDTRPRPLRSHDSSALQVFRC
ncbi:hypothetical protein ACIQ62_05430 [Streptomyces sp. NPDC096319]|uniref:hypothetical protein n=1 Tax=Streptomyces sp. NPDC096319 TaxID=3366084 RepID=UPI0037F38C01